MILSTNSSAILRTKRVMAAHTLESRGSTLGHTSHGLIRTHSTVPTASGRVLRNVAHTTLHAGDFVSTTSFRRAAGILNSTTVHNGISALRNLGRGIVYKRLVPTNANRESFSHLVMTSVRSCGELTGNSRWSLWSVGGVTRVASINCFCL